MSEKRPSKNFRADLDVALVEVRTYFDSIISHEESAVHLSTRLNGEVPAKLRDIASSLSAIFEDRLVECGEKTADAMTAQMRIRYYDDKVERQLASECPLLEWIPWHPVLTERVRTAGFMLTGVLSVASLLAALRAAGLSSVKIPIYAASPMATALIFAALTLLSGVTATKPEKIPSLMNRERCRANAHLSIFLHNTEVAFLEYADKAEKSLDAYFENLKGGALQK